MAETEILERLIVQFEADVSKMEASLKKATGASKSAAHEIEGHWSSLDKFMGKFNGGEALEKIFSRSRLGLIEEGGARIGVFGSALEALGPAGLAAGAGLVAAGIGFEQAKKALEYAEALEVTAKKLGETTMAIQQMDYVAAGSGVSQEVMREGLQKVSEAIGAYQSNVKDARVKSVFEALGISKDDARAWKTPVEGLEAIADKIHALKSTTEQLALAKSLRVPPEMVPLLQMGGDKIREMRGEADRVGAVMDHSMVEKAGEMAAKLKETQLIIDNQLHSAFLNLAPAVIAIVGLMAKMAQFAADTAENLAHVKADGSMDYSGFSKGHLGRTALDMQGEMNRLKSQFQASDRAHPGANSFDAGGDARNQGMAGDRYNMLRREWLKLGHAYGEKLADEKDYAASVGGGRPSRSPGQ